MKGFIKNNIFGFILGAVLFGGVGTVLATVILASNITSCHLIYDIYYIL